MEEILCSKPHLFGEEEGTLYSGPLEYAWIQFSDTLAIPYARSFELS